MSAPNEPEFLHIDLSLYAGRYIALIEGRIVAVADTADSARVLAQRARPQRQATILYIAPADTSDDVPEPPLS